MGNKILVFAGSARAGSWNKKLAAAAATAIEKAGGAPTLLDLAEHRLPLYDGDLEEQQGLPDEALALKRTFESHDGLCLACPEYNGLITPLLKNTIDWVSRSAEGEGSLQSFGNLRAAALLAASPGGLGGLRGLVHVRALLGNIGVLVLPDQLALPKAHEAFTDGDPPALSDPRRAERLGEIAEKLVATTVRMSEAG